MTSDSVCLAEGTERTSPTVPRDSVQIVENDAFLHWLPSVALSEQIGMAHHKTFRHRAASTSGASSGVTPPASNLSQKSSNRSCATVSENAGESKRGLWYPRTSLSVPTCVTFLPPSNTVVSTHAQPETTTIFERPLEFSTSRRSSSIPIPFWSRMIVVCDLEESLDKSGLRSLLVRMTSGTDFVAQTINWYSRSAASSIDLTTANGVSTKRHQFDKYDHLDMDANDASPPCPR